MQERLSSSVCTTRDISSSSSILVVDTSTLRTYRRPRRQFGATLALDVFLFGSAVCARQLSAILSRSTEIVGTNRKTVGTNMKTVGTNAKTVGTNMKTVGIFKTVGKTVGAKPSGFFPFNQSNRQKVFCCKVNCFDFRLCRE